MQSDTTQAPGPEWQPFISLLRVSERGSVCVCTCVHMVRINMLLQPLILTGKRGCLWGEGHREGPNPESFISSCLFLFVSVRGRRTLGRQGLHWAPISGCPQTPHSTGTGHRRCQRSEHGQNFCTGVCLSLLHQSTCTQVNKMGNNYVLFLFWPLP